MTDQPASARDKSAPAYDLVVIGAGSGGLSAVEFAVGLGLRVALVERERVGGDRLWTGCVPSKALLASARAAHTIRTADRWGLGAQEPAIDLPRVWRRIRAVQADVAATGHDPQRYRELGADVCFGVATVTAPDEVTVQPGDGPAVSLSTRFVLICTGGRPALPAIEGLDPATCLTSEHLFTLDTPPNRVAVIGGGPMGTELGQALQRLGITTTLLQRAPSLLPREEPALVARLTAQLRAEGLAVHCSADVRSVTATQSGTQVVQATVGHDGTSVAVEVDAVLVAAGRLPNVDGLGLDSVGVEFTHAGVQVDERGRTSVRSVYAAGDVTGRRLYANAATFEAVQAVRDMFFPGRGAGDRAMPWCTFTDPELAHIGLTVAEAEPVHGTDTDVWRIDLDLNDRARTDAVGGGIVAITAKGRLVGAHILAPGAGEMIHEFALAIHEGLRIDELAELPHVYPTLSSSIGQLATEAAYEKARRLRWMMKRR